MKTRVSINNHNGLKKTESTEIKISISERDQTCYNEGHLFSEWKRKILRKKRFYDNCFIWVHENEWYRTCERCGFKEKSRNMPPGIVKEQEKIEREKQIKLLERKLDLLKNSVNKKRL